MIKKGKTINKTYHQQSFYKIQTIDLKWRGQTLSYLVRAGPIVDLIAAPSICLFNLLLNMSKNC